MTRQGQTGNTARQLFKHAPEVQAGICFLVACCLTLVYSVFNGHLFSSTIAGALLLTTIIALYFNRKKYRLNKLNIL